MTRFPDRHFWQHGYDKAFLGKLAATVSLRTKIRSAKTEPNGSKNFEGLSVEPRILNLPQLGAAFLYADLALTPEPRPDHAAYVASWLKVLRGDKRAILTAAAKAQQAADWMHARQSATAERAKEAPQARAA